jgi:hypothetical protein
MSELRQLKCDVKGCPNGHLEEHFNQGHPGWGHVAGLVNAENGENIAHVCPEHLKMVKDLLNGGWGHDLG